MKEKIKTYLKNPVLLVFIFVLIFLVPQALYSPGQNRDIGVVVAVGIDKKESEYEISLLTFIPTANQTYKETDSVISGKGESMAKALYKAQIAMGRRVGLSHAKTTVVNEELLQNDVTEVIDYLSRVASLPENTVIISTNDSAKDFLAATNSLETNIGLQLEQAIGFNSKYLYVTDTSLEALFSGYYGPTKSSLIGHMSLVDGKVQEEISTKAVESETGGGESLEGGSSSSNNQAGKKEILNKGEAILLKNGKMVEKLSTDELTGINLLNKDSKNQIIIIEKEDEDGVLKKYSYQIKSKIIHLSTSFENGYPVLSAQTRINFELMEIDGDSRENKVNTEFSGMDEDVKEKIDVEIKRLFTNSIKILKNNNADVMGVTNLFFKNNRKEFEKFIKGLNGEDEFIGYVNFKLNLVIDSD